MKFMTGAYDGANFATLYVGQSSAQIRINTQNTNLLLVLKTYSGLIIGSRTSSNIIYYYRNGSPISNGSVGMVSNTIPDLVVGGLCLNNSGSFSLYTGNQLSLIFYSKSLSSGDVTALTNAFEAYMDSNGKGVIA